MQILIDIHQSFKCRTGDGPWGVYKDLIIRENIPHQLDTNDSVQLIIYLDADTSFARQIRERYTGPLAEPGLDLFRLVRPDRLQQMLLKPDPTLLCDIIYQILRTLAGQTDPIASDARILETERLIAATPPDELTIGYLAAKVFLSESRLRALFKAKTGISLHKYISWARIRYAISRIMSGCPINDAALEAGFVDSSHFHKMLVTMFGVSPSQFIRDNKAMELISCEHSHLDFQTKVYDAAGQVEKVYK